MIQYFYGTKAQIEDVISKIDGNCGFSEGNLTRTWDIPLQVQGGYVCVVPQGSHGFTKEEMLKGITFDSILPVEQVTFLDGE